LAHLVRLEADEYELWFEPEDGFGLPESADTPLRRNRKFSVPNKAYIVEGELTRVFRLRSRDWNHREAMKLKNDWQFGEGFDVDLLGPLPALGSTVSALRDRDLYAFAFFGLGNHATGGMETRRVEGRGAAGEIVWPQRHTLFRIGEMKIIACNSNLGAQEWAKNVSSAGWLTTIRGLMFHFPFPEAHLFEYVVEHGFP
jgi:hypothetical protein